MPIATRSPRESRNAPNTRFCHPEQSEGSRLFCQLRSKILRLRLRMTVGAQFIAPVVLAPGRDESRRYIGFGFYAGDIRLERQLRYGLQGRRENSRCAPRSGVGSIHQIFSLLDFPVWATGWSPFLRYAVRSLAIFFASFSFSRLS